MSLSLDADAPLLARVAVGDAAAFDALYARYGPLATALAHGILRAPELAEDAVQDAFLALWRQAPRYDPARGTVQSWLLTIVRHCALDALRRRHAERWVDSAALAEIPAPHTTPELARQHAEVHLLRTALAHLPAPQRAALTLAYAADYSHARIARAQGIPLGTVKGRLRLGLRALHTLLAPHL